MFLPLQLRTHKYYPEAFKKLVKVSALSCLICGVDKLRVLPWNL
jgi:hypothetical protein